MVSSLLMAPFALAVMMISSTSIGRTSMVYTAETSFWVAVIVAVPAFFVVSTPSSETLATEGLFTLHSILWSVVLAGTKTPDNVAVSPSRIESGPSISNEDALISLILTVTESWIPFVDVAVITVSPQANALIFPSSETDATAGSSDAQTSSG